VHELRLDPEPFWTYRQEPYVIQPSRDYEGFVYLITNKQTNRKYIGKKSFWSRVSLKSGRKQTIESDWKKYYGSSDELSQDIKLIGKHNFNREILHLCRTKKETTFFELQELYARQVLLSEEYYNKSIQGKFFKSEMQKTINTIRS
jgi:hypothetical protein